MQVRDGSDRSVTASQFAGDQLENVCSKQRDQMTMERNGLDLYPSVAKGTSMNVIKRFVVQVVHSPRELGLQDWQTSWCGEVQHYRACQSLSVSDELLHIDERGVSRWSGGLHDLR
jgi:hypothetical protein